MTAEAFFLPADGPAGGQRLCLYHPPQGRPRAAVVYVHPFAEEMNKCRRMAALASRAFAGHGIAVLQVDLLGCGDSSGEFAEATWPAWVDDVDQAARWLRDRIDAPLWLWGLRAGCLLATEAARRHDGCRLLWWSPLASGKVALQQFLRLRTAAELLQGSGASTGTTPRSELAAGRPVEIAGYTLPPALAHGLEGATLSPSTSVQRLHVMEVSATAQPTPSPAVAHQLEAWRRAGIAATGQCVTGPSFWQTTEIEEAPALIDASRAALLAPLAQEVPA